MEAPGYVQGTMARAYIRRTFQRMSPKYPAMPVDSRQLESRFLARERARSIPEDFSARRVFNRGILAADLSREAGLSLCGEIAFPAESASATSGTSGVVSMTADSRTIDR